MMKRMGGTLLDELLLTSNVLKLIGDSKLGMPSGGAMVKIFLGGRVTAMFIMFSKRVDISSTI
jgi:hypothetical protein